MYARFSRSNWHREERGKDEKSKRHSHMKQESAKSRDLQAVRQQQSLFLLAEVFESIRKDCLLASDLTVLF